MPRDVVIVNDGLSSRMQQSLVITVCICTIMSSCSSYCLNPETRPYAATAPVLNGAPTFCATTSLPSQNRGSSFPGTKCRSTLSLVITHMRMQPPDEPSLAMASARAEVSTYIGNTQSEPQITTNRKNRRVTMDMFGK